MTMKDDDDKATGSIGNWDDPAQQGDRPNGHLPYRHIQARWGRPVTLYHDSQPGINQVNE
jgi:hypothetical protein